MNVFGQLLHVEEVRRDGVLYRIAVIRIQGGLHGTWSCDQCNMDANEECARPSIEESLRFAKKAIAEHHDMRHSAS
jgi:hypothetical protein